MPLMLAMQAYLENPVLARCWMWARVLAQLCLPVGCCQLHQNGLSCLLVLRLAFPGLQVPERSLTQPQLALVHPIRSDALRVMDSTSACHLKSMQGIHRAAISGGHPAAPTAR